MDSNNVDSCDITEENLEAALDREIATQLKRVPTQSCYVSTSQLPGSPNSDSTTGSKKTKSLVFGKETKTWCGLRPERMYMDELVHQFFVLGKQFNSVDVLRLIGLDSALVSDVNTLLKNLCARILIDAAAADSAGVEEDGVPVLLQGGGRGMKVNSFHYPYLGNLQQVVAEAEGVVSLGGFSILAENQDKTNNNAPEQSCNEDSIQL